MKQASTKSKTPVSTNWLEDPTSLADLPEEEQSNLPEYRRHWHQIRTQFTRQNHLLNWYNYRLSSLQPQELINHLEQIFTDQKTEFKINVSFGFILRNNETGVLQYYYASRNNNLLFESPFQIATEADLQQVRQTLEDTDILEWVRQQRPNSKWVVEQLTNVTFFMTKLRDHPIGRGKILPHYIVENRGIVPLDRDQHGNRPYNDNLCFFRALALHNGCHVTNLKRDTNHYYERYRETMKQKKKFRGVKIEDLPDLEHLFEVNVFVYSLEPTKPDGDDEDDINEADDQPEISAQFVYRSLSKHSSTLYLNLYQNHFSYIKDLKKYSKSFCCSRCGKFWKRASNLRQHEKTCEAKVRFKFPGGAYKTPPTIFELLEDEGFTIPHHLKFFPYRATFDFECMFNSQTGLDDTEKLTWRAKHIPLSVSVCSNVPFYSQPKCFVSNGDSKHLIKDMVEYLVDISKESYRLMKAEFQSIYEAIDHKLGKEKESSQTQSEANVEENGEEDEGEDLMDTDGEEDDIESETEEDRAFIDDA